MAADTEVCTMNEEQDVEIGGKPGNRFKERMGVTLLEWQNKIFFFLVVCYNGFCCYLQILLSR